ncbi:MAG: S8 family serine peptidase [Myxococcota bacterium]
MVLPRPGYSLADLAPSLRSRVMREPGPAGYGALEIPTGLTRNAFLDMLRRDGRVLRAAPDGIIQGASDVYVSGDDRPARRAVSRARWHIVASNPPADGDAKGITIALLDTGVAYEDHSAGGLDYRRAPSLAGVRFVAPWDFINGDAHPNDDHQHGTHLASLIAAAGAYPGIAPGVSIMPIKVLDRDNVGTELALVDGIVHAVTHGADIINMSLSFGRGYVPSRMLVEALERAAASGAVLVAAAGNDGGEYVSQPAANPLVVAVGANRPEGVAVYGAAPYSNASPRVDLMAPGGSVDEDRDGDGLLDGVIGETIALGDPSRTGYWLYAGTSQATALVSGAAARLLADGRRADEIRVLLQGSAAVESYIHTDWVDGRGRGRLDVTNALALGRGAIRPVARGFSVALLGWLAAADDDTTVRPAARVTVLDEQLLPAVGVQVVGTFAGVSDLSFTCVTDAEGMCSVVGPAAPATDLGAWTVSADDVVVGGVSHHPRTALYASEGLQALLHEMRVNPDLVGTVPVWRWRAQEHPMLGRVAASYVVGNLGTGIATSPQVVVATPGALGRSTLLANGVFEVGGGAPASHPVTVSARTTPRCDGGAAAWEVLDLADADVTALVLDATGLGDTPLALGTPELMSGGGARACALDSQPFVVATGERLDLSHGTSAQLSASPIGEWLADGGWTTPSGEPAATAIAASVIAAGAHGRLAGSGSSR